ncbi:MAG: DUF4385 domain-containing protein [Bdellovibrionota bacterium]
MPSRAQVPRRATFLKSQARPFDARRFDYSLDYGALDLRQDPALYRVGVGEQGVLLVQPYKSEILPRWRFRTPAEARASANAIRGLFENYRVQRDFVGMDMARKFLQMGYTRSRRYANHASGRKYASDGTLLPFKNDSAKATSAQIFFEVWKEIENDFTYALLKLEWRDRFG